MEENIQSIQTVCQFLKDCDYYMLATAEGNQPRVRPFGTVNIFENKLYIETLHRKRTAQQLSLNNHVELCAMSKAGDAWIRVSGTLVNDPCLEPKKAMLDAYPFLQSEIALTDPDLAVYYFDHGVAWISREGQEDEEWRF